MAWAFVIPNGCYAQISRCVACLSKAFGSQASFVAFDALATPVPTACGVKRSNYSRFHTFFQQQKKVSERGTTAPAVQKCRSQAPRGWHSCGSHNMRWPAKWVAKWMCVARRPCALCAMVFSDGFLGWHFAMAYLTYCVTSGPIYPRILHFRASTGASPLHTRLACCG